ncbi:hypothetical protein EVAR_32269_1 [Eumeta japonica]|uniref:Uncharacterized protein n=1 Tax=Eumeta variegata TaxID=151549 RepID=A0A4C1X205_EUMVA|nr:hypothetical protein EVAR_32269_1 [Eumeta japonica]
MHAGDRRPSDADERRPRRGSMHRRSSSSSRSNTCQRATAPFFFFWPSSGWSIRSARGPPKHRFTIRAIVPTMSGRRPTVCSMVGAWRVGHSASDKRRRRPYQRALHVRGGRGAEPPAF